MPHPTLKTIGGVKLMLSIWIPSPIYHTFPYLCIVIALAASIILPLGLLSVCGILILLTYCASILKIRSHYRRYYH